jgi:hypothetical protein
MTNDKICVICSKVEFITNITQVVRIHTFCFTIINIYLLLMTHNLPYNTHVTILNTVTGQSRNGT